MSKKSRAAAKKLLEQYHYERSLLPPDILQLEDARTAFYWQRYSEAGKLIFDLSERLIVEPHKDTEEYKNGERKLEEKVPEPEEETETILDIFEEGDANAPLPERDEDGYLIR